MIILKYSVIVPVYNTEKYLDRCVSSIISQSFDDYELILVDDGSSDGCPEICDHWAENDKHIKVIHQENGGQSTARNAGLKAAAGDYILFVDSDDYVSKDYFAKMEEYDFPDGWLVYTNLVVGTQKTNQRQVAENSEEMPIFDTLKYLLSSRTLNGPCTKKYSGRLIERHQLYFEDMVPAEDFIFSLRYALLCKKIKICNQAVYVNDQTNSCSTTRSRKHGLIDVYPKIFDRAFSLVESASLSPNQKRELYKILDKLHVESFGTCVMEELKDNEASFHNTIGTIRHLCKKFYGRYKGGYGYQDLVHFVMRVCIRYRLAVPLYTFGKIHMKRKSN